LNGCSGFTRIILRKSKTYVETLREEWNIRIASDRRPAKAKMSEPPSILIVEDEYPLQGVLESVLADAGFASDILSSGEEAITVFVAQGKHHKALVTDIYLGGQLNGWDLARRMREKDPTLPVVYITGSDGAASWTSQGVPNSVLLEKPFQPERLVAALMRL
jgi:DNA-binding response OmpR family regulator